MLVTRDLFLWRKKCFIKVSINICCFFFLVIVVHGEKKTETYFKMYTFIVNKSTKTKVSIYNTLWPSFAVTLFGFTADLMVQNMRDGYS